MYLQMNAELAWGNGNLLNLHQTEYILLAFRQELFPITVSYLQLIGYKIAQSQSKDRVPIELESDNLEGRVFSK